MKFFAAFFAELGAPVRFAKEVVFGGSSGGDGFQIVRLKEFIGNIHENGVLSNGMVGLEADPCIGSLSGAAAAETDSGVGHLFHGFHSSHVFRIQKRGFGNIGKIDHTVFNADSSVAAGSRSGAVFTQFGKDRFHDQSFHVILIVSHYSFSSPLFFKDGRIAGDFGQMTVFHETHIFHPFFKFRCRT